MTRSRSFGVAKMAGVALAAFGFAFALVPLYRIACEKVFGVRLEQGPQAAVEHEAKQERWVTVQFDGGVNSKLPWQFAPEQQSMRVQVGRQYEALYFARNTSDRGIVGSAKLRCRFVVAQDAGDAGQCLQVIGTGAFRRKQQEHHVDRLAVE